MAGTSWGAASRLLRKDIGEEERALSGASRRTGLHGSVGSTVGGLLGLAAINAWNPVGWLAAGIAGAATLGGGLIGRATVSKEDKQILKGEDALFLGDERKEIRDELTSDLLVSAGTSAVTAGMGSWAKAGEAKKAAIESIKSAEGFVVGTEITEEMIEKELISSGMGQRGLKEVGAKIKEDVGTAYEKTKTGLGTAYEKTKTGLGKYKEEWDPSGPQWDITDTSKSKGKFDEQWDTTDTSKRGFFTKTQVGVDSKTGERIDPEVIRKQPIFPDGGKDTSFDDALIKLHKEDTYEDEYLQDNIYNVRNIG